MSLTMQKLAFVLSAMASTCHGYEERNSPFWQSLREDTVSAMLPTSKLHQLETLATLFLAYRPQAAFNSGPAFSPSLLHRAATGRRSSNVRLQQESDVIDPFEQDLSPETQAIIEEQLKWDERGERCAKRIKGMPIYIVGMGRRKDYMATYMVERYFWGAKNILDIPKMTLQWFPEVAEGFKYKDATKPNITECLDRDVELVEEVQRAILLRTKGADDIIICADSAGSDEDWEFMKSRNGIIVQIVWDCDPDAYDDVWLPKKDKYEIFNRWNASHYKGGADIVLDIREGNEDTFRPDLHGINLVDKIMKWMDAKEEFGSNAPLVAELQKLKKSELRKRAIAEGVEDDKLDEADDADDPKAFLVDAILEKIGAVVPEKGSAKVTEEELKALKRSELRKRAEEAGASAQAIDDADDADDAKEAFIKLIMELE